MSIAQGTIVIAAFEDEAPSETARTLLREFGITQEPSANCRWHGPGLVSLKASHAVGSEIVERVEDLPGLRRLMTLPEAGQLVQGHGPLNSHSRVELRGGVVIGDGSLTVMAGPCTVENEAQVRGAAEVVAEAGAKVLRGGVFKARSSPYSFSGLGERGLELMAAAGEATGLPIVTEALEASQLDVVCRYADMIQIGSRNMQNFPLLFEAGAHASGLPILLKRGLAATIQEFLQAAEYVLMGRIFGGHEKAGVVLCERGIRTFDDSTRFTMDVGAIPVLQQRCALPVIADPSHAAGARPLVAPLGRASVAAGAEGLLVEVHPEPEKALCDGAQSLNPEEFRALMQDIGRFAAPTLRAT